MTGSDPCELLEWDSDLFGFPVASVRGNRLRPRSAAAIEAWCRARDIRCLYLLADFDDPETAQLAAEHGFVVVDIRLRFRHRLEDLGGEEWHSPGPFSVREAEPDELPALSALIGRDQGSRFRFDDFPQGRADQLYAAFVERGLRDASRCVLVPEIGGEAAGFDVVRLPDPEKGGEGHLELVVIDERNRTKGAGAALVTSALRLLAERGASSAVADVPARNVMSVRMHERIGFRCDSVAAWHHRWFGEQGRTIPAHAA